MSGGSDFGATLGVRLAMIGSKVRETSLARTTPALVQMASQVADQMAGKRAEAVRSQLVGWLGSKGVTVPPDGELSGLLGGITKAGGWLAQNVIGTAVGFGVGQALSAVLQPYFNGLVQAAWRSDPNQLLSPAELALAVLRGNLEQPAAEAEALSWGVTAPRFQTLVDNTGEPPGVGELLSLWRRGKLSDADLERGVRQSRVRNEWLDTVKALGIIWPSWSEFLDAYLEGQVGESEARALYAKAGGDPELFDLLFNTRGQAPTPNQALDLLNRGIIAERGTGPDQVTYEQAFLEGPWRNKWLESFLALRRYIIPPRSVTAMMRAGAIDQSTALQLYALSGLTGTDAQAMASEGTATKLAPEKDLAKADVMAAYADGILDAGATSAALGNLGYAPDEADLLMALADHKWEQSFRDAALRRVHNRYVTYKITADEAQAALGDLGLAGKASAKYLAVWDIERELPQAELTEPQMRRAWVLGIVDQAGYEAWLGNHGYAPDEVQILVGIYTPTKGGA